MKSKLLAVAAAVLFASVANASTFTLDFEDSSSGLVHDYTVNGVTVSFTNAAYFVMTGGLPAGVAISQDGGPFPHPPLTATFSVPVTAVSVTVLGGVSTLKNTFKAFDADDALVASTTYVDDATIFSGVVLSVAGSGITRIELDGQLGSVLSGWWSVFDDLTVTPTPTPLPAALPLYATGLGALGLLSWRRKRKAQPPDKNC